MKYIFGIALAVVLAGVTYAAALALTVTNSPTVQVGTTGILECDPDGVSVSNFAIELDDMTVASFKINDIEAACNGLKLVVRLYDASDNDLGGGAGRTIDPISATTHTINLSPAVDAVALHHINIAIHTSAP